MKVEKYGFDLQRYLTLTRRLVAEGTSCSDIVIRLHDEGLSVVSSVEVVSDLYKTDMTTGKKIVFSHSIWKTSAEAALQIHDVLIENLNSNGKIVEKDGFVIGTIKLQTWYPFENSCQD